MRALEAAAIASGTPERELQERAGRAVAEVLASELSTPGAVISVLAGPGKNGRDAVVAARYLRQGGHQIELFLSERHALEPAEIDSLRCAGVSVERLPTPAEAISDDRLTPLAGALARGDVAIDGLLGVGAHGPLRADLASAVQILNATRARRPGLSVLAVDVPSGVDADDGSVSGDAVRADLTVTFGAVKTGLLRFPGAGYVGRLEPRSIGLNNGLAQGCEPPPRILDQATVRLLLPARPLDAHKYRLGRVLVVAGSDMYVGAACLCAAAAARSGCGLVAAASTAAVKQALAAHLPEVTYPVSPFEAGDDPYGAADRVAALMPDYQAAVVGPGLGRSAETANFLQRLLTANAELPRPTPLVIDADALSLLADWEAWWEAIGPGHVLTPHAGELARLAGDDWGPLDGPPWELARAFARRWEQVVALKGPFTSIASPSGEAWVYPRANPALASAGTGDVLAGLCAGLLAQGLPSMQATKLAVTTHALAARRVTDGRGWRTLLASDLLVEIPAALEAIAGPDGR